MEIQYRNLKAEDYDKMIEVWNTSGLPIRPRGRDSRVNIIREISHAPEFCRGAFDGERLVGLVIATSDGRKGWINRLAVLPEYRHKGIAKVLVEAAEEALYATGIKLIACLVLNDNRPSLELFESAGYRQMEKVLYLRKISSDDV